MLPDVSSGAMNSLKNSQEGTWRSGTCCPGPGGILELCHLAVVRRQIFESRSHSARATCLASDSSMPCLPPPPPVLHHGPRVALETLLAVLLAVQRIPLRADSGAVLRLLQSPAPKASEAFARRLSRMGSSGTEGFGGCLGGLEAF